MSFVQKVKIKSLGVLIASLAPLLAEASKPHLSRDRRTCEEILSDSLVTQPKAAVANNSFVPLSTLLSSTKCQMVAKNWREGPFHSKIQPTPGMLEMFRTADVAAADVIQKLGLKGVATPFYDHRSPLEGAAATLTLMESKPQPKYIRNAVLVREGVFTVVPLLMLHQPTKKSKPVYVPLIAKGHQDLSLEDTYTAAFTAWALEPWVGAVPDKAYVHLVPMAQKRVVRGPQEADSTFELNPHQYLPIIREVYQDFVATVSNPQKLEEIEPRRCTECNRCPWASYCRGIMKDTGDLSMMPFPLSVDQVKVLKIHGFGSLSTLAKLDVNSTQFLEMAARTGVSTRRLRYAISHARAANSDKPIKVNEFDDPFENKRIAVHVDFEDLMDPKIRSGVYLFGFEYQDLGAEVSAATKKEFVTADSLTQESIDSAWAQFIRTINKDLGFDRDDWLITTYSKHENVKFDQQFNIVKGVPEDFSAAERKSNFYSQYGPEDKPRARFIRERAFFERHPDIDPRDVFAMLDRTIDGLDYVRHFLAFPTYSNGIKHVLKYVNTVREPLTYPEGANGLESMVWAAEAYVRGEVEYFEKARDYNEIDIDALRLVIDYVRDQSRLPVDKKLRWAGKTEALRRAFDSAIALKNSTVQLLQKQRLFEKATKIPMLRWNEEMIEELMGILHRGDYMAARTQIASLPKIDPRLKSAKLQKLRFEYLAGRQRKLYEFLKRLNPQLETTGKLGEAQRAFVELLRYPAHMLNPNHLTNIVLVARMQKEFNKLALVFPEDMVERLAWPDSYLKELNTMPALSELAESYGIGQRQIEHMWQGLYLAKAFGKEE